MLGEGLIFCCSHQRELHCLGTFAPRYEYRSCYSPKTSDVKFVAITVVTVWRRIVWCRFRRNVLPPLCGLKMKTVNINQTTWHHFSEDSNI
jgi:hypothetical protein